MEDKNQEFYFVHYQNLNKDSLILKDQIFGPYDSFNKAEVIAIAAPMAYEWGGFERHNKWMWISPSYRKTIIIYVSNMNDNYDSIVSRAIKNQTKSL